MKHSIIISRLFVPLMASILCGIFSPDAGAWEHKYIAPTDPAVLQKLDQWQDLKFGVIFHWGIYSVPGIMESWNLCAEDEAWEYRYREHLGMSLDEFRQWYWGLNKFFNPTKFDPSIWADVMKDAGMKYMVFTTKHHDGFCMYDTKYTDYKITNGPFGSNPRSNVTKEVLEAFRQKGFMVGEYFSKPDWHCEWYWNPLLAAPDRMQNYDRAKHPDWWQNYVKFTMNQLEELTTDYGHIDILWLDGGQISGPEVNLGEVLKGARERHPGLISVDRAQWNEFENYQTPENEVPEKQLDYPWETCYPLCSWGYQFNPNYRSINSVIARLTEIVAKGGNLLLGIGPTPWGTIDDEAQAILRSIGDWLDRNGEAIYSTRITPVYNDGKVWFTAAKDGSCLYGIYAIRDGEELPQTIEWTGNIPTGKITALDGGKALKYSVKDGKVSMTVPRGTKQECFAFKIPCAKN